MVKLLESSVRVMISLLSVFQQLKVSIWRSWDLGYIFDQGDQLIKSLKVKNPFVVDELLLFVKIESFDIKLKMLHSNSALFTKLLIKLEMVQHLLVDV